MSQATIRRVKRVPETAPQVMLTSMIDMFTILLVFLLKSYTAIDVSPTPEMKLPLSSAERLPEVALKVTISKNQLLLDDKTVAPIKGGKIHSALKDNLLIVPLYDALKQHAQRRQELAKKRPDLAKRLQERVIIVGDQTTPAALLDEVFYTISQRGFEKFHLVVTKKPSNPTT